MGAGPGGGWRWAQLAVHSRSAPERSRAAPQPFGLKAPQAAVPASRGPAWRWGGAPPFPSPPSRGPIPQIPLTRTLRIPLGQGLAWPLLSLTTLGGGACCPRPPPAPRQCWRQLWGASGRKNGEGRLHQKRVIWHRTGTGTGARRPGRPRKAPPDILLSEGPSPALGTGSISMGGIQARQVQELRVESHPPRGGRCPFRRICTALPAGHVPRRTGQRGLGAPSGRVGVLQRAVLVPEGGEHVSVEIVGPSWGERPALSRAAREAGLQGTCW